MTALAQLLETFRQTAASESEKGIYFERLVKTFLQNAVEKYPLTIEATGQLNEADYRVDKMKFGKAKDREAGKMVNDRSVVIYNNKITLRGIPETAWGYIVNGKAALDWVMERQGVRVDKASGIVNDANDWAIEAMGNPKYPLELFQRVVTVSLETQKIVGALPALDIREDG